RQAARPAQDGRGRGPRADRGGVPAALRPPRLAADPRPARRGRRLRARGPAGLQARSELASPHSTLEPEDQALPPIQAEASPLTDPAFLEDPYPVYRRMRQHDPVYWSDALGHWVLTRYDDVPAATRHPALSSARTEAFVRAQLRGSDPALAADYTRITRGMMIMKDGPDHHRLRVLGNHAFTPSALRRWQAVIERVVDDLLDAALPRGRMDLIADLAGPLPAIVIAELFGIPPEDRELFHQ